MRYPQLLAGAFQGIAQAPQGVPRSCGTGEIFEIPPGTDSAEFQRICQSINSINLCLHVATPTAPPPKLRTSISLRLQRASRPPYLNICRPAARFQSSIPPYCYTYSAPPYLHVAISTTRLHTSTAISTMRLHTDTSLHLQRSSRVPWPPCLHIYHVATPAARLQSSMPPCLRVATPAARLLTSRPPGLYTSMSLHM